MFFDFKFIAFRSDFREIEFETICVGKNWVVVNVNGKRAFPRE